MKNRCNMPLLYIMNPQFNGSASTLNDGECGDDAYFFLQVPCLFPPGQYVWRQLVGLGVSTWAVFVYFFTLTYFQYIQCVQKNKYIDWDIKTITAADYTVEFDLHKDIFETFLERYYDPSNPISEIAQFRLFIKDELE